VPTGEDAGEVVFREKVREDAVRGELWGMSRWTMADLRPPNVRDFITRLNSDRARSRRLYCRDRAVIAEQVTRRSLGSPLRSEYWHCAHEVSPGQRQNSVCTWENSAAVAH